MDSRKDERAAWAFGKRMLLFLSPLVLFFFAAELALWRTGDALPSKYAYRKQQAAEEEVLYGRDFLSEQFGLYKLTGIKDLRPEILVVGSSRVMQMRGFMFAPLSFYNAGGMVQNVYDLQEYAHLVTRNALTAPRVLIVGIDPWWLKEGHGSNASWLNQEDEAYSFPAHVEALRRAVKRKRIGELMRGVFLPHRSPYSGYGAIGSIAIRKDSGFRRDGSWQYSTEILIDYIEDPRYVDRERPPVIERIRLHKEQFALPASFDHRRAGVIVQSLEQLRRSGIEVWVLLPPFSTECIQALGTIPGYARWWNSYKNEFVNSLRSRGMHIVPVASPPDYDLDDRCMFDGFHASEVFMARVVAGIIDIAPETSPLSRLDGGSLRKAAESSATPLSIDFSSIKRKPRIGVK